MIAECSDIIGKSTFIAINIPHKLFEMNFAYYKVITEVIQTNSLEGYATLGNKTKDLWPINLSIFSVLMTANPDFLFNGSTNMLWFLSVMRSLFQNFISFLF